ncbi:nuclear transport factor 2 family protein [Georgenia sp. SYP-B2076]|uniref:nuclear transport factor 2 family protein n=1 Tax=Georgenia sp. SYP-B2076 TaxID=2495881 RepID=UPI000F8F37E8|nr:nuclear transport factor 2 family protein [Georgenia sp. SYP-B2076]
MDDAQLSTWLEGYVRAWNSNDPADIGALFTDDAEYRTEPYAVPWRGREAIVRGWLAHPDEPGQTKFQWSPLVVTADLAVVRGTTEYRTEPPRTYSNLWTIRLDGQGLCTEFTEWWMEHPHP